MMYEALAKPGVLCAVVCAGALAAACGQAAGPTAPQPPMEQAVPEAAAANANSTAVAAPLSPPTLQPITATNANGGGSGGAQGRGARIEEHLVNERFCEPFTFPGFPPLTVCITVDGVHHTVVTPAGLLHSHLNGSFLEEFFLGQPPVGAPICAHDDAGHSSTLFEVESETVRTAHHDFCHVLHCPPLGIFDERISFRVQVSNGETRLEEIVPGGC